MNKTHFSPRWPLPPTWGMEASICLGSYFVVGAVLMGKVDGKSVELWKGNLLSHMNSDENQNCPRGDSRDQNLYQPLILALLYSYVTNSPRDQTPDYGWQGSFGGAWFYVVAEHGDSRISGFGDPERFENFHFQCLGSEIHVSTDLQCYQLINYVQLRQHSQRWRELCTSFRFWLPYAIQKKRLYRCFFWCSCCKYKYLRSHSGFSCYPNVSPLRTFV